MDTASEGLLRFRHGHAHSRIQQRVALAHLRIRALPSRYRNEEKRQSLRDPALCLLPMQRHVLESEPVQFVPHGGALLRPAVPDAFVHTRPV